MAGEARLRVHDVTLRGQTARGVQIRLRPLTEADWDVLYRWNSDPEVLYYSEGDNVDSYTPEDVRGIFMRVSQTALCFIIEAGGVPVGECWLQAHNYERVLRQYPDLDCRRIDLSIGEKARWGQGIGTETIRLLTEFAFLEQGADLIYNCEIGDYNPRSRRAFQRVGYEIVAEIAYPPGGKARVGYDLALTRDAYFERTGEQS
jgi:RimJ/RimL family protein N-acetyltransferase